MTTRKQALLLALAASGLATGAAAFAIGCSSTNTDDDTPDAALDAGNVRPDSSTGTDGGRVDSGTGPRDGGGGDADAACPRPFVPNPYFDGGVSGVFCPNKAGGGSFCGQAEKCCTYATGQNLCAPVGSACPATNAASAANVTEFQCVADQQCAAWDAGAACCVEGTDTIVANYQCPGNTAATGVAKSTCQAACAPPTSVGACAQDGGVSCEGGTTCTAFTAATSGNRSVFLGVCR